MSYIDITMTLQNGMVCYPGDPPTEVINIHKSGIAHYRFASHAGTHFDAPAHVIAGGKTAAEYPADYFFGKTKVFAFMSGAHISIEDVKRLDIGVGDIVLFKTTGSMRLKDSEFFADHAALLPQAAQFLADKRVKAVGIDYLSIDCEGNKDYAAHCALLGAGIPIIECVDLLKADEGVYFLKAMFLRAENADSAPMRAILEPYTAKREPEPARRDVQQTTR